MRKGHKPDFHVIANIGRASCGQLLVANYTGKRRILYAHFYGQTVVEVAHARGFSIVLEYRLNRTDFRALNFKIRFNGLKKLNAYHATTKSYMSLS